MKVIVTKENESVICNGKIYSHGQSFKVADVIGKSLIQRGFCSRADEEVAEMQTGYLDENQLNEMSYADLKRLAAQMGVDASGKKEELIARICGVEVGVEPDAVVDPEGEPAVDPAEGEDAGDLPNTDMPE